jgi:hypothetical protein
MTDANRKYLIDGRQVSSTDIFNQARERADQLAPPPKHDPVVAGVIGMAAGGFVIAVFAGVARLDIDSLGIPFAITCAVCFAMPYFYFRSGHSRNSRMFAEEYTSIIARATEVDS